MNPTAKRLVSAMMAACMACALVPATPARAEEDLPEWAGDANYQEVTLLQPQEDLPAKLDLRDRGVVTPVRLQNPWASCWAFAGIAAAETSIISDLGAPADLDLSEKHLAWYSMHTVKEVDAGNQAGEGITVFDEATNGGNAVYIPSNPVLVSTIFSTGVGPVFENDVDGAQGFPYRGAEGLTDLDVFLWPEPKAKWKDYRLKELIKVYGSEEKVLKEIQELTGYATIDAYLEAEIAKKLDGFADGTTINCYSGIDDWSIPDTDEDGDSNRNLFAGYTLRHGNELPSIRSNDGKLNELGMLAAKQELMDGHGVYIAFCADTSSPNQQNKSDYINLTNWAHYTYKSDKSAAANHGVCIVGWDDNYEASKFTHSIDKMDDETAAKLTTPPGNGAWICKNSWGCKDGVGTAVNNETQVLGANYWGIDGSGYFYISYYDQSLLLPESYEFDDDLDADEFNAHVYDYLPSTNGFFELTSSNVISTANIFTADENEQVVSVSTRSTEPNSHVKFALYKLNDNAQSPVDGTKVEEQEYDIEFKGFHRFDLNEPFKIRAGEKFSIVSTVSHKEDGAVKYDLSASRAQGKEKAQKNEETYYGTAVVHKGESAFYMDGKWYDWYDYQQTGELYVNNIDGDVADNFSIKAFALPWSGHAYACVAGDGATWTKGSADGLAFTFEETTEKAVPKFDHVTVDGMEIDSTASLVDFDNANMVTTLSADFLSMQMVGEHTLTAYFEDGDPVTVSFTVVEPGTEPVPDTKPTPDQGQGQSPSNNAGTKKSGAAKGSMSSASKKGLPKTGDATSALPAAFLLASGGMFLLLGERMRKSIR